ncbi:hypothetical protein [Breoghania sp. L-A4]|uniref:hypothetical protein n=1 Tax=Breoghania sp. L-A4 TaxID=2304600 RepID=UPI001966F3FE|nr:hypothetical protein [Breoghania sp. L-A4]
MATVINTMKTMRIEDFEDILDRRGSDLDTWSKKEAAAARALLEHSREARALLEESHALQQAFAPQAPVRAPAGLADRIVREALASSRAREPITQTAATPPQPARFTAGSLVRSLARSLESLRDGGAAVFQTDTMLRPAAVLMVCFVSGMIASYANVDETSNVLSEVSLPTFFTYFDLS